MIALTLLLGTLLLPLSASADSAIDTAPENGGTSINHLTIKKPRTTPKAKAVTIPAGEPLPGDSGSLDPGNGSQVGLGVQIPLGRTGKGSKHVPPLESPAD